MAENQNGSALQWPAKVRDVTEHLAPVNAPSCYRVSLVSRHLEVTARVKGVDDLDLLMNVLESHRAFFVKNGHSPENNGVDLNAPSPGAAFPNAMITSC
jgi:hypothetical protein